MTALEKAGITKGRRGFSCGVGVCLIVQTDTHVSYEAGLWANRGRKLRKVCF